MVTGISSAQYKSNKNSNDAVMTETIAQMIAYDVRSSDVSGITVASESVSAFSGNMTSVTLHYSVNKNSYIFNDADRAVFACVTALNDSVSTGVFDDQLHVNGAASGNSEMQRVTTVYIIVSTASPTSSPTSQPTKEDLVNANILGTALDARVARSKIQYYLGSFVGYFFGIFILLYLFSFTRSGISIARQLYDSSYQSYSKYCNGETDIALLKDLQQKNLLVSKVMELEEEIKVIVGSRSTPKRDIQATDESGSSKFSLYGISLSDKMLIDTFETADEDKYSKGYREYMQQRRTLLGCAPLLYPNGYSVRVPFVDPIELPPGRLEDFILYLCHNHPLFSCFYFMDGSKLGAHGNRILYIGKDIVVFVLYQFSNLVLQYYMLDGHGLGLMINILLITPSAVFVRLVLKYLYVCPFTETVEFQRKYAQYQWFIIFLGRASIVPIMFIMSSALIIACLFSSDRRIPLIIVNFFVFVQFYGIMLAIAKAMLLFVDGYYFRASLFGAIDVLSIGALYKERIMTEGLVADVDYAFRTYCLLNGCVVIEKILNKEDAIKAKWIDSTYAVADIEMTSSPAVEKPSMQQPAFADEDVSYNIYDVDDGGEKASPDGNISASRIGIMGVVKDMFFNKNKSVSTTNAASDSSDSSTIITENPLHAKVAVDKADQACQQECALSEEAHEVVEEKDQLQADSIAVMDSAKYTAFLHKGTVKNTLSNPRSGARPTS